MDARKARIGAISGILLLVGRRPGAERWAARRAGRLVLVHVLTVGLIALHEMAWGPSEAAPPAQADLNRLRDHVTQELATLSPTHARSSKVVDCILHSHVTASGPPIQ